MRAILVGELTNQRKYDCGTGMSLSFATTPSWGSCSFVGLPIDSETGPKTTAVGVSVFVGTDSTYYIKSH